MLITKRCARLACLKMGAARRPLEERRRRRPALLTEVKRSCKKMFIIRIQMAGVILHCTKNRQRAEINISRPTTPISERYKNLVVMTHGPAAYSRFVPFTAAKNNRADRLISFRAPPTIDRGYSTFIPILVSWFVCIFYSAFLPFFFLGVSSATGASSSASSPPSELKSMMT